MAIPRGRGLHARPLPRAARAFQQALVTAIGAQLILRLAACAEAPLPPPPQQAPLAATPQFLSLSHTSRRPTREGSAIASGDAQEVKGCPSDPRILPVPAGGGLLLRFTAPVPTDLGMSLDTSQGPRRVVAPKDLDDEARLAQSGRAYFYENDALSRAAPTGSIAPREVLFWPGQRGSDLRFDISLWDISFAPQAVGAELRSAAMKVSLVGRCPELSVSMAHESIEVRIGEIRRVHARVIPAGDGVGTMTVALAVTGAPAGITLGQKDSELASADWSAPRETTFDVGAGPAAVPGKFVLTLHARLGAIERSAALTVNVLPKDDY